MRNTREGSTERTVNKPTTLDHILKGRAKITHNGEDGGFLQDREIGGRTWPGRTYVYDLEVPKPSNPDEIWATELRVWSHLPLNYGDYVNPPSTQLCILTGHGEMQFSKDPRVVASVISEIHRQLDKQRRSKEKK